MDEKQTRLAAANLLLERGVRYRIADAPLWQRTLHLDRITIRALRAGTILEFSRVMLEGGLDTHADDRRYLLDRLPDLCRVIAIAALNSRLKIRWLSSAFARWLQWRVPASVLVGVFLHIAEVNNVLDFTTITGYMSGQMKMLLEARTPGQTAKGS